MNTVEINGKVFEVTHIAYGEDPPPPMIVAVQSFDLTTPEGRHEFAFHYDILDEDSAARGQALGGIAAAGLRAGGSK